MSKPAKGEMTIHALAERTGMTVRNIRAHQTRGLLPPPTVRGRTGYYDEDHVARIELIRQLQADGLNLEAIRRVLAAGNGAATEIVDLTRALRAPFEEEVPEIVELGELASHWGEAIEAGRGPELLRRAERLGVLRTLPEGKIELISPRMMQAAVALADLGFSPDAVFAAAEKLRRKADGIAAIFAELFIEEVWNPFDRAGRPEGDWPKVREALDRTRPLGADVLMGAFQIAMAEATEEATRRTIQKVVSRGSKSRTGGKMPPRKRARRS
jgi:DNA-binding transcriptional MerR regulator